MPVVVRGSVSLALRAAAFGLAALIALAAPATAAGPYPDRPVTLIVPYAAGGSSDVLARLLNEPLSKSLGQPDRHR